MIKVVTAVASVMTAAALWTLLPRLVALPSPAALLRANERLTQQIAERDAAVAALQRETAERLHTDGAATPEFSDVTAGEYVRIAVTDTGTGMAPDVRNSAFEPFVTAKAIGQGSGLGLRQVYGFVKQSHGHVTLDSSVGTCTTVAIYLRRAAEQTRDHADVEEDQSLSL